MMANDILLYVPNIIGYIRLLLLLVACTFINVPLIFIIFYTLSTILDGIDGYAARKLNQVSAFGAWFDVVIDLIGRGIIWTKLYHHLGSLVLVIEWMTFLTTVTKGPDWKSSFEKAPWFVRSVMARGFKMPMGIFAISGLHVLPIWLYLYNTSLLISLSIPLIVQYSGIVVFIAGRALCMAVEMYCIKEYIQHLLTLPAS